MIKNEINNKIYLDSAATTKVDKRVLDVMQPFFSEYFGNASSNHSFGITAKEAVEKARIQVSKVINCDAQEIIFTSGSTESINLAIKGYTESNIHKGNHIITVKTEHKAVLSTCEYLETKGYEVTYLDVNSNGLISMDQLRDSVRKDTILIVIMYVNNETGIIQPIEEIGKFSKEKNIAFFCDASQAVGRMDIDVEKDCIDLLCFSGHKIKGPKGIGVLFKKEGVNISPLIHGGGQEGGLRGGTYNTPLIVGIGKACEIISIEFYDIIQELLVKRKEIEEYYERNNIGLVNFKTVDKAPHILSITINEYEAEEYLMINSKEFAASTGSACNSQVMEISHVLKAMGVNHPENIIRISIEN